MADDPDIEEFERRMQGALDSLKRDFGGLRSGRASASLLEPVVVDAYGSTMPINQVGTVGVPEPRLITVQVWDKGVVAATEKAIRESGLGLNPQRDGQLIRIPIPELTEDRRRELGKVASKYAEQARVAVRNIRRDGMDTLKRLEKEGDLSEDDHKLWSDEVQALTDKFVKAIDEAVSAKEAEIMQI